MPAPAHPKIYHILHIDRLASVIADGCLWCDAEMQRRGGVGTMIGMSKIKERRLNELKLASHPELFVGDCVPFYFCPRSIMLYLIHQANHPELTYRGGQGPIVHLEADMRTATAWADQNQRSWAFTLSNAGSRYFEDRSDLRRLDDIDWTAVQATNWQNHKEGKQAEFLMAGSFPWRLIERIGVCTPEVYQRVIHLLPVDSHQPVVQIKRDWYY